MLSQDTVAPHRLRTYIFVFPHKNHSGLRPKQMRNPPDVGFDTKIMCMTICSIVVLHTHRFFRSDFCALIYRALKELDNDQSKRASGSRQPNPDARNGSGRLEPFRRFSKMCPICSHKDPIPAAIGLACARNSARDLLPREWWSQQAKAPRVDSGGRTHLTCWSIEVELSIFFPWFNLEVTAMRPTTHDGLRVFWCGIDVRQKDWIATISRALVVQIVSVNVVRALGSERKKSQWNCHSWFEWTLQLPCLV